MSEQIYKRRKRYKGTHPRNFEEKYKELDPEMYPETIEKVNAAIDLKAQEMETSMNLILTEYTNDLEAKIAEFESRNENIDGKTA